MEAIDRGLAKTQLESALLCPLVLVLSPVARPFPFDVVTRGDMPDGEAAEDEVDDLPRPRAPGLLAESSVRKRLGVSGGKGVALDRASLLAAFSRLLLRSRVARSGLLAVPCERYIERLLVWRSVSSTAS